MKIYHGSYIQIQEPVISVSNRLLDYGNGFYTTTDINQAVRFTEKFLRSGKNRILNYYEFDYDRAVKELSIREYSKANEDWLTYIVANRSGRGIDSDFDIVIGPVANDRVYTVVESYELGDYTAEEAIMRLKAFKLTDQIVFKCKKSLQYISFIEALNVQEIEIKRNSEES
ncbi:hypothetical protein AGMMS49991_05490 [Spirochaetia bacterium]|nr:hypothetical protein AGMMS49991_05490 [Spirochaetia bacterium]